MTISGLIKTRLLKHLSQEGNGHSINLESTSRKLQKLVDAVLPYTMMDRLRLQSLFRLVCEACEEGVEGDIVECGVCNGGSAAIMAAAATQHLGRRIWLFDTFEGIPAPGSKDGDNASSYQGDFVGSIDLVKEIMGKIQMPLDRVLFRKGPFLDTFSGPLPQKVAVLHIDADWYDSVLLSLRTFYPILSIKGIVILDDFGHWEGTRKAFYTFCREYEIEPLIERMGYTQAFWKSGREHNRDIQNRFQSGSYFRK